jgi:membrane protein required for colicin V production
MNHVDIILTIPLAIGAIRGFSRGFIMEAATLIGLIAGVYLAALFAKAISIVILGWVSWNPVAVKIISFVITFVLVYVLVIALARFVEKIFKLTGLNLLNRLAGIVAGILKIAFILSVVLIFFNHLNRNNALMSDEVQNESFLYNKIATFVPSILPGKDYFGVVDTAVKIKDDLTSEFPSN